jgi:putative transposase
LLLERGGAVSINGKKCRLWSAVDQDGYILDEIAQVHRNIKAAMRLLTRLLTKQGMTPKRLITDKLRSYGRPNASHARRRA